MVLPRLQSHYEGRLASHRASIRFKKLRVRRNTTSWKPFEGRHVVHSQEINSSNRWSQVDTTKKSKTCTASDFPVALWTRDLTSYILAPYKCSPIVYPNCAGLWTYGGESCMWDAPVLLSISLPTSNSLGNVPCIE